MHKKTACTFLCKQFLLLELYSFEKPEVSVHVIFVHLKVNSVVKLFYSCLLVVKE